MNQQRIVELWDKANSQYYQSESDQPLPQFIFAELIVQECIDVIDVGGEFVSRPKMVERLKQHFGVEE